MGDFQEAAGEVVAALGIEADVLAILVELQAVAVEFHLMHPRGSARRFFGERWEARVDKWVFTQHGELIKHSR